MIHPDDANDYCLDRYLDEQDHCATMPPHELYSAEPHREFVLRTYAGDTVVYANGPIDALETFRRWAWQNDSDAARGLTIHDVAESHRDEEHLRGIMANCDRCGA